jgi:CheY-like chemotaxis protein/HPt (histidine-containing phosphotransfer) domain-containing protein
MAGTTTPPHQLVRNLPTLVVDADPASRARLEELLLGWRMWAICVASGEEALTALTAAASTADPFRLVLLSAALPDMPGIEVAERVLQDAAVPALTILLMGRAGADGAARVNESGIAQVLDHPVRAEDLYDAIASRAVELTSTPVLRRKVALAPTSAPLRILVVEDNAVNRRVASGLLGKRGHAVTTADDGRKALDRLEQESFDVVLMDIQMPELDGFQATAEIRELERLGRARTPIIAMTALAAAGIRERCLESGMDDYVAKPIDVAKLMAALDRHTGGRASTAAPSCKDNTLTDTPEVQRDAMLARLGGDESLFEEIVELMQIELPRLMGTLREAVGSGDAFRIERAAHTLKSCVGHLGVNRLQALAKEIEYMGRDKALGGVPEALAELTDRTERVLDLLPSLSLKAA